VGVCVGGWLVCIGLIVFFVFAFGGEGCLGVFFFLVFCFVFFSWLLRWTAAASFVAVLGGGGVGLLEGAVGKVGRTTLPRVRR